MAAAGSETPEKKASFFGENWQKILVSLVATVSVILSPIRDWAQDQVKEIFIPTQASVTGVVSREGQLFPGLDVSLQSEEPGRTQVGTTDDAGRFRMTDVRDGPYTLVIQQDGTVLYSYFVDVPKDSDTFTIPSIDVAGGVARQFDPPNGASPQPSANPSDEGAGGPTATPPTSVAQRPIPSAASNSGAAQPVPTPTVPSVVTQPRMDVQLRFTSTPAAPGADGTPLWDVTVWVEPYDASSNIRSVTYYLHPTFQPAVVTRYPTDNFRLDFATWGSFELGALVTFNDGSTQYLTTTIQ